jgi:hypothetical protein
MHFIDFLQSEEARIAREVEAHEKRIRKELEKQDILRRKVRVSYKSFLFQICNFILIVLCNLYCTFRERRK